MSSRRIKPDKTNFTQVVLKVTEEDEHGRPRAFRLIRPEEEMNIAGGERFVTGYLHAQSINERRGKA